VAAAYRKLWDHYRDKDGENTRAAWTAKEWLPTRDEQHAARNRRDKAKKQREDRTTPAVGERPALGRRICGGVEATMGDADGGAHGAAAGPGAADASVPPFLGFSPSPPLLSARSPCDQASPLSRL